MPRKVFLYTLYHYTSTSAVVGSETLLYSPIIQLIQLCCLAPIIQLRLHSSQFPRSSVFPIVIIVRPSFHCLSLFSHLPIYKV